MVGGDWHIKRDKEHNQEWKEKTKRASSVFLTHCRGKGGLWVVREHKDSRESLLLRRVAALRLRARKDSVGVMSRSTMRLSHGLRRRLRADTRGHRQCLFAARTCRYSHLLATTKNTPTSSSYTFNITLVHTCAASCWYRYSPHTLTCIHRHNKHTTAQQSGPIEAKGKFTQLLVASETSKQI